MNKLSVFLLTMTLVFHCAQSQGEEDFTPVGQIGDRKVTEFDIDYAEQSSRGGGTRESLIKRVARNRLGAIKAEEAEIPETSSEVKWRLWSLQRSIPLEPFLTELTEGVTVEESAIREYYDQNKASFKRPASYSFYYIFCDTTEIESKTDIDSILRQMESIHSQLVAAASEDGTLALSRFQEVAEGCECADSPRVQRAGPFSLDEPIQETIKRTALSLAVGAFSPVVSTKYGFQIIRLDNKTEEGVIMEYKDIRDRIESFLERPLKQERIDRYLSDLKNRTDRYTVHPIQLKRQLPGAHREDPESPYVVEVDGEKWEPADFKNFMRTIHRQEWLMSHRIEKASQTVLDKLVVPSLLYQDAKEAGFADRATEIAKWEYQRDQLLAYYWVMSAARQKVSEMPRPTTDEYLEYYESNPQKFRVPEQYRLTIVTAPLPSATDTDRSPAQVEFDYRGLEERMKTLLSEVTEGASPTTALDNWKGRIAGLVEETEWFARGQGLTSSFWDLVDLETRGWVDTPFRTAEGVAVVQVLETRDGFQKPFDPNLKSIHVPVKEERLSRAIQETWIELEEEAWEKLERLDR